MDFISSHAIVPDSVLFARTTISQSSAGQAPWAVEWNTYTRPSGKLWAAAAPNVAASISAPAANVLIIFILYVSLLCRHDTAAADPTLLPQQTVLPGAVHHHPLSGDVIDLDQGRSPPCCATVCPSPCSCCCSHRGHTQTRQPMQPSAGRLPAAISSEQ